MWKIQDLQTHRWLKAMSLFTLLLALLWTGIMGVSLAWNINEQRNVLENNALLMGRTAFQKDVLYRAWSAGHGGVYVPVTDQTQPNPYLADHPARDITTTTGTEYTLINPAYMTRQVFEMQTADSSIIGHITSLKPIRPENGPDAWETQALQAFERGVKEVYSVETIGGEPFFRYMSPLIADEPCLKCHASQGYQVGEVRGGISESVRLAPLESAQQRFTRAVFLGHAGIWSFGLAVVVLLGSRLRASLQRQVSAETRLVELSTFDPLTGAHTRGYFEETLKQLQEIKQSPVSFLSADVDDLKKTNDLLGHAAGDLLLKRAAALLRKSFRDSDFVARTGGDEFIIILPNTDQAQAALALERVRKWIARWNSEHPAEPVSISLGIATADDQTSISEALKQADQRMYADKAVHKQQGKG